MELRIRSDRGGGGNQLALYNRGRGLPRTNPASALTARHAKLCATKKLSLLLLPIIRSVNCFSVGRRVRVGDHHRFPSEMTSDKRALRFHTDDAWLSRAGWCFWLVVRRGTFASANQKHYLDHHLEFLPSFLRLHFVRKSVVAPGTVGCFLRLISLLASQTGGLFFSVPQV